MKKLLVLLAVSFTGMSCYAQLLTWSPLFPTDATTNFVITVDATKGNQGLLAYTPTSDVYIHTGVITTSSTSPTNWRYVRDFGSPNVFSTAIPQLQATYLGNNKWQYTIPGDIRSFYGVAPGEQILKIALLFRSGNGARVQRNSDGSDMYIPIYTSALATRVDLPAREPRFIPVAEQQSWSVGTAFGITGVANQPSTLKLYHNNVVVATSGAGATSVSTTSTVSALGNQQIVVEANDGSSIKYDTLNVMVELNTSPVAPLPAGLKDGINYEPDNGAVTLVLHAPGKNVVSVIGDFNNWTSSPAYTMNKTPDGSRFWLRITGLTAGMEYGFQYKVDNNLVIADPYTQKVLDPNDVFISAATYPGLKAYPSGKTTGIVSVLQTAEPGYSWGTNNYNRPDKRGLVIYEMLVRDFVAAHDWKTVRDTLSYLKRLGVNAIEVMPFNEFEGNISWGYNTDFYFAPDKYYGPKKDLKQFIDSCHANGIAVIMDMVLNHTYGPSPLARLYWDAANNRPAANNPWYNAVQPHAFGFGDDFNHESAATKNFFNRVLQHWIAEYKIDGYRLDFTKGLTQKPSTNDANFSAYDASRIAIINGYHNAIKSADATAYTILEHFADNTEEKELSDAGMLLWANVWTQYQEASMGYLGNSNFQNGIHTAKGWTKPHLVNFMESHDEERITYKNIKYGNSSGSYNIKDTATALKRMELNTAFFLTIPGPKMIWQFGELGYDYSRCYGATNGEGGDCNTKLDPKPIRWDYQNDTRRKAVFDTYRKLNGLRSHPWYKEAFMSGGIEFSLPSAFKWIKVTSGDSSQMLVVGNFDVNATSGVVTFPSSGTWYDYLGNTMFTATGSAQSINLAPGEYHVYVNRNVNNVTLTPVITVPTSGTVLEAKVFPNPAKSQVSVEMYIPESGATRIELLNAMGQSLGILSEGFRAKGNHTVSINRGAAKVASGHYYLKISVKNNTKIVQLSLQ